MKKIINTNEAPAPIGPYNQAVQAAGMLFVSGQIAINPENGQLLAGDITIETYQVMANLKAILKEAGLDFSDVVKTSIFLSDMAHFAQVNDIYQKYFDFLESQPCPCGRSEYCGGDGLISCFIKGSYNEERSSGTVPAASEID